MRCPVSDCEANAERVAKDWIDIHVLSTGAQRRIPTSPKALARFAMDAAAAGALVVFEASGGYERPLLAALDRADAARRRVNPRQARDFARATGRLAKTDQVDAAVLAEMGAGLSLRPDAAANPVRVRLADLARRLEALKDMEKTERPLPGSACLHAREGAAGDHIGRLSPSQHRRCSPVSGEAGRDR